MSIAEPFGSVGSMTTCRPETVAQRLSDPELIEQHPPLRAHLVVPDAIGDKPDAARNNHPEIRSLVHDPAIDSPPRAPQPQPGR